MVNLAEMPHVLVSGATGSGKSSCINSVLTSILTRATPDQVRLILVDPKRVELGQYNDLPHLLTQVVVDPKKAANALSWAVTEMERRYDLLAEVGMRDITGYNAGLRRRRPGRLRRGLPAPDARHRGPTTMLTGTAEVEPHYQRLPFILIVVDELNDLMMVAARDVEESVCRIAQMARAVGIHLVLATQRPSVDVITGVIKANIPSRMAFSVSTQADSRVILDQGGAERLIGKGDMLLLSASSSNPQRLQGPWVSEEEVRAVAAHWKRQRPMEVVAGIEEVVGTGAVEVGRRGRGRRPARAGHGAGGPVPAGLDLHVAAQAAGRLRPGRSADGPDGATGCGRPVRGLQGTCRADDPRGTGRPLSGGSSDWARRGVVGPWTPGPVVARRARGAAGDGIDPCPPTLCRQEHTGRIACGDRHHRPPGLTGWPGLTAAVVAAQVGRGHGHGRGAATGAGSATGAATGTAAEPAPVASPGAATSHRHKRHSRRHPWRWPLAVVAIVLLVRARRRPADQPPAGPARADLLAGRVHPGARPACRHCRGPRSGQGAVSVPSIGYADQSGPESPVPIASLTKMATAVVILRDHPLAPGSKGRPSPSPRPTWPQYDVRPRQRRVQHPHPSWVRHLTERQMLEALMNQSANDVAFSLAVWDAGSLPAFVAKMNALAVSLGATAHPLRRRQRLRPAVGLDGRRQPAGRGRRDEHPGLRQGRGPVHGDPAPGRHRPQHRDRDRLQRGGGRQVRLHLPGRRRAWCWPAYRAIGGRSVLVLASALGQHVPAPVPPKPTPPAAAATRPARRRPATPTTSTTTTTVPGEHPVPAPLHRTGGGEAPRRRQAAVVQVPVVSRGQAWCRPPPSGTGTVPPGGRGRLPGGMAGGLAGPEGGLGGEARVAVRPGPGPAAGPGTPVYALGPTDRSPCP